MSNKHAKSKLSRFKVFSDFPDAVPFQPSVQSWVTNDFELSTSGVLSRVMGCHEHLPVSIFAKFWPILLTNEWFWCLSQPKFGL